MNVMTKTRLDIVPLTEHIGAEIRGLDLRERPDDETVKAIYQAWLDHLVANKVPTKVVFRSDLPKSLIGKVLRRKLVLQENEKHA